MAPVFSFFGEGGVAMEGSNVDSSTATAWSGYAVEGARRVREGAWKACADTAKEMVDSKVLLENLMALRFD